MYTTTFHNWSKEEERNFFDRYYEEIIKQVEPKLFAVETIKRLKKENEIYIITARFDLNKFNIRETTGEWLTKNGILYDELILNAQNKAKIAKQNNIDIFIDDSIKNCEEISKEKIKTFMMDSIINKEYKNDKIKRVYSWPHLYQEINNLKEVN